jgi:V8-like Glu-specific endopeptidase
VTLSGLVRTVTAVATTAAAASIATGAIGAGTAQATASTHVVPAANRAVVRTVGRSARGTAARFWTKSRMESATPVTSASGRSVSAPHNRSAQPSSTIPNPVLFNGVPTVGALFFTTGTQSHFCTASVVKSASLDLILTAAHCVYGSSPATNIAYVPEWHDGISPYGEWPVTSVTVASGWAQDHDDNLDFAFLTVAPPAGQNHPIQVVTGGLTLGIDVGYSHNMFVIGQNDAGSPYPYSEPLGCATQSFEAFPGQMQFYCNDYWDGTSGGPWILHLNQRTGTGTVFGDIGGYEQGGDYAYSSYSDYYGLPTLQLYRQAEQAS